jgi:signal transduction histidine kinase
MKKKPFFQTLASIALFVAVFLVCNVLSFGLIFELLYDKLSELSIQIIASLISLTMTITILVLTRFSLLISYRDAFVQASEVIKKVTEGDFDVAPAEDYKIDNKLGGFVKSIDTMVVELKKVETMRREFVSNVSHEIQSPLTSIRGYAKAMENANAAERREYLNVIQSESDRLSRLSENLLRLASLDSETAVLNTAGVRLDRQIRSVILAYEPEWAGKDIDIGADLQEISIQADKDLLSHIWMNLIGNAIKFTPDGGKIYVCLSAQKNGTVCKITDTGIGIAPEALPHIFDRFYKADESRGLFKGSGLGLSIAKKIAELHGGNISAESEPGKGTTFCVTLPTQSV